MYAQNVATSIPPLVLFNMASLLSGRVQSLPRIVEDPTASMVSRTRPSIGRFQSQCHKARPDYRLGLLKCGPGGLSSVKGMKMLVLRGTPWTWMSITNLPKACHRRFVFCFAHFPHLCLLSVDYHLRLSPVRIIPVVSLPATLVLFSGFVGFLILLIDYLYASLHFSFH